MAKRLPKGLGKVRQLPSGRWQAQVRDDEGGYHRAPVTFDSKGDATAWLQARRREIDLGVFTPPQPQAAKKTVPTLAAYCDGWLAVRTLKPRTAVEYRGLLDRHIVASLGPLPLDAITPDIVRTWHAACCPGKPATRAKAYSLLKTILATAVDDDVIDRNPCRIKGAGTAHREGDTGIATPGEVAAIAAAMPDDFRLAVLLAAYGGLRLGEVLGLRRMDVDPDLGVVHVRQAAVKLPGGTGVGTPKTRAGRRTVAVPPHVAAEVARHLGEHCAEGEGALLFPARRNPGNPIATATFYKAWYKPREAAGPPDLPFHGLRHTGATWTAQAGATLGELMARLGHTAPAVAMRYQHHTPEREAAIAEALGGLAEVVPLRPRDAG